MSNVGIVTSVIRETKEFSQGKYCYSDNKYDFLENCRSDGGVNLGNCDITIQVGSNGHTYLEIMSNDPSIADDGSFPGVIIGTEFLTDLHYEGLIEISNAAKAFHGETDRQKEEREGMG